jgi:hypothetical protein
MEQVGSQAVTCHYVTQIKGPPTLLPHLLKDPPHSRLAAHSWVLTLLKKGRVSRTEPSVTTVKASNINHLWARGSGGGGTLGAAECQGKPELLLAESHWWRL